MRRSGAGRARAHTHTQMPHHSPPCHARKACVSGCKGTSHGAGRPAAAGGFVHGGRLRHRPSDPATGWLRLLSLRQGGGRHPPHSLAWPPGPCLPGFKLPWAVTPNAPPMPTAGCCPRGAVACPQPGSNWHPRQGTSREVRRCPLGATAEHQGCRSTHYLTQPPLQEHYRSNHEQPPRRAGAALPHQHHHHVACLVLIPSSCCVPAALGIWNRPSAVARLQYCIIGCCGFIVVVVGNAQAYDFGGCLALSCAARCICASSPICISSLPCLHIPYHVSPCMPT